MNFLGNFGLLFAVFAAVFGQSIHGAYIDDTEGTERHPIPIIDNNKEKDTSTLTVNFGSYANYQRLSKCPTKNPKLHFLILAVTGNDYQTSQVQSNRLSLIPSSGTNFSATATFSFKSKVPTKMPLLLLNVSLSGLTDNLDFVNCVLGTFEDCRLPIPFTSQNSQLTTSCANIDLNYNFAYDCYDPNNEFGWGCTECRSYNDTARCNTCNTTTGVVQCCDGFDGASCYAVTPTPVISTETPLEEADHMKELYYWIMIGAAGVAGAFLLLCLICSCCTAYYRRRYSKSKQKNGVVPYNATQMSQFVGNPHVYSTNNNMTHGKPKINQNYQRDASELSFSDDKDNGFKESPRNNNNNYQRPNHPQNGRRNQNHQPQQRDRSASTTSESEESLNTTGGSDGDEPLASSSQPTTPPPFRHQPPPPAKPMRSSERHLPPPPPPYRRPLAGFNHTPGIGRFPSSTKSSPNVNADVHDNDDNKPDTYV